LHIAIRSSTPDIARLLLEAGARVSAVDCGRNTPLTLAVSVEWTKLIIKHSKSFHITGKDGSIALTRTTENGNLELVRMLLSEGVPVNCADPQSRTPLHFAAMHGLRGFAEIFYREGPNMNAQDNDGWTALHMPCSETKKWSRGCA
ncbi:ankyrin, partial [Zopfia rhizophila CBS 207.26]